MVHGTGVGRKVTTAREVVLVNRRKMSHLRAVSPRRSIPERRSKRSRSKLSSVKVRLLNQATLSSAQMSENASKNLPRLQQRLLPSRINPHNSNRHNRNATSNRSARRRRRLRKTSLRSLPMHLKARVAEKRTTRRTKAITDPRFQISLLIATRVGVDIPRLLVPCVIIGRQDTPSH